jgi:hypothetical protein
MGRVVVQFCYGERGKLPKIGYSFDKARHDGPLRRGFSGECRLPISNCGSKALFSRRNCRCFLEVQAYWCI